MKLFKVTRAHGFHILGLCALITSIHSGRRPFKRKSRRPAKRLNYSANFLAHSLDYNSPLLIVFIVFLWHGGIIIGVNLIAAMPSKTHFPTVPLPPCTVWAFARRKRSSSCQGKCATAWALWTWWWERCELPRGRCWRGRVTWPCRWSFSIVRPCSNRHSTSAISPPVKRSAVIAA